MKKNYIKPETAVVLLESENLMAQSITNSWSEDGATGSVPTVDEEAMGPAESKGSGSGLWDD